MKDYNIVTEYFGKSLMLVNFLESQSALFEEKITLIKNSSYEKNIYEDFLSTLRQIKNNCKKVKDKLSVLAFDLSAGDETLTEILDDVYLHQKQLMEIVTEMTNKNILYDNSAE
jgi:hypothetical protein